MSSNAKTLMLTQYPIVDQIKAKFIASVDDEIDFLVISTLASDGYFSLLRQLGQKEYKKVGIFIADETSEPLVDILKILSLSVNAKERFVVYPDHTISEFSWLGAIFSAGVVAFTILYGFLIMALNFVRAGMLVTMPRCKVGTDYEKNGISREYSNIAYVRTNLWLGVQAGGALTHTWGVIRGFARRGVRVHYMSADAHENDIKENFIHVPVKPQQPYVVPRELNHFIYHRQFLKTASRKLRGFKGAIYQRVSVGNFVGVELSRRLKLPLILEYNGSESWLAKNWGTPFLFKRAVALCEYVSLRHAHVIVTVSDPLRDELIERGINPSRIVVHPNGVDHEKYDPKQFSDERKLRLRARLNIPSNAVVVSFVGTFGPWHGAEILSKAAKRLAENDSISGKPSLYFVFIGDGVRRPEVERNAEALVRDGHVILTGLVNPSEIPDYLAASDILAAPTVENPDKSQFFGSPTKVFEYMAAAKPLIASDIGQIADIMAGSPRIEDLDQGGPPVEEDDNILGVLVAPGQVSELCDAILFLANRPDMRAKWGATARGRVLKKYTWDNHVSAIQNHLTCVVDYARQNRKVLLINGLHSKSGGGVTYLRNMLPLISEDSRLDVHLLLHKSQLGLFDGALGKVSLHTTNFGSSLIHLLLYEQLYLPFLSRILGVDVTFSPANYGPLLVNRTVTLLRNSLSVAFVERRMKKILYWTLVYGGTVLSLVRAKKAIAVSSYAMKSASGNMYRFFPNKFEIVGHGINKDFKPNAHAIRNENEILCVSDVYVQKNLHNLFSALPRIVKDHPDIKLKIAGALLDQEYAKQIMETAERLGVRERIDFVGSLQFDELLAHYRSCTLFVFPSTVETFGNPLVEAMACGAPTACSMTAAMPDVARDGAEFFNPHDSDDIARVINKLLSDSDLRKNLTERGLARAKAFSWDETARKTADILIEAANK